MTGNDITRREFLRVLAVAPFAVTVGARSNAAETTATNAMDARPTTLPPWKPGEFQVHFIYTGVAESMFWIMPDGTTMLLDCGDHPAWTRGKKAIWILPDGKRHAGEWIARYVERVNPSKRDVDYLMVSHHHADHGGMEGYGGILQAADTLKFKTCFDRGWPDYDEPLPNELGDRKCYLYLRKTYDILCERDGMKMAKFDVGAVDQIAMRRTDATDFVPSAPFHITNICGNGKILCRDGSIRNLYGYLTPKSRRVNENAMSLGLVAEYGKFRFYTAGDFSDVNKFGDGTRMNIEEEIAKELSPVDVAKVNHHGHHSMPLKLVAALRPRVWTACMWDTLHITADTLGNLSSRDAYPGPRLIAAPVFMPSRRIADAGKPFMADIAKEAFEAGHVVVTVAPGGESYTVAYVTADDESMRVTGAYRFKSGETRKGNTSQKKGKTT